MTKNQVIDLSSSYVGENPIYEKQYLTGKITFNIVPQGTLAERCRIGAAGIAATFVKAGVGTYVETGGFPMRLGADGKSVVEVTKPREKYVFGDREYLLEEAIHVDFALIKAYQADRMGNLRFRKTARNFNQDMAGGARVTLVEAEEIVDEIPPEKVHYPGCLVDRVYKSPKVSHKFERLRFRDEKKKPKEAAAKKGKEDAKKGKEEAKDAQRLRIAARAVKELADGMYCNLGIGIPTMVANAIEGKVTVELQGENGMIGIGPYPRKGEEDADLSNASKEAVTAAIGHSYVCSSGSFGMMRGLHMHMTMLGSLQVSEKGDIANWIIPGQKVKGMGGAMDLVSSGYPVIVVMEHVGPGGSAKFLKECTVPLTGKQCVSKLITDLVNDKSERVGGL